MAKPYKQYPQKPQQPQQQAQAESTQDEQVNAQDTGSDQSDSPLNYGTTTFDPASVLVAAVEVKPTEQTPADEEEQSSDTTEEETEVSQPAHLGTQDASTQAAADDQAGAQTEVTEPVAVPAPVPALEEAVEVVEASPELTEEEAYLEKIRESGTLEQKRILAAVETFVELFDPKKPLSAEAAVAGQHEFLQHMLWLLKKEYETFKGGWNALLVYFAVHHGNPSPANYSALSEYSAHRARHAWAKSPDLLLAFENLIAVLRATRVKATRQHDVKRLAFDKIGSEALTEQGLSNLKKFYGV